MAVTCESILPTQLSFSDFLTHLENRRAHNVRREERYSRKILEWQGEIEVSETELINSAGWLSEKRLDLSVSTAGIPKSVQYGFAACEFVTSYSRSLTRLDGSRSGPVFLLDNAFALTDCLAAGRFGNAQVLHDQAVRLLDQRAYDRQKFYAEDLERKKDPSNFVEIIPQRLFVFVHELMGQRAGQAKQPWAKWDIVGDKDYIEAARAVYTDDPDLAAATVCKLCNLHVQYSNPFPEGDNDDHLVGIEFDTPIRSLWPTEIFAWLRLRQERGLPLPEVEHPLLEQPLGHFDLEIARNWQPEPWFAEFLDRLARFNPRYKDLPNLVFGAG